MSENTSQPDTRDPNAAEPSANERGEHARAWIGWACATLGLPVAYFLSVGPALLITEKFHLNQSWIAVVYHPLIWLHRETSLRAVIEGYARLWIDP